MNSLTINLNAELRPIVDGHEGDDVTVKHGGPVPFILIEFEDDGKGNDTIGELLDLKLTSTGLNNEQVAYFLHELAHMMLEPDSMTEGSVPLPNVESDQNND